MRNEVPPPKAGPLFPLVSSAPSDRFGVVFFFPRYLAPPFKSDSRFFFPRFLRIFSFFRDVHLFRMQPFSIASVRRGPPLFFFFPFLYVWSPLRDPFLRREGVLFFPLSTLAVLSYRSSSLDFFLVGSSGRFPFPSFFFKIESSCRKPGPSSFRSCAGVFFLCYSSMT